MTRLRSGCLWLLVALALVLLGAAIGWLAAEACA